MEQDKQEIYNCIAALLNAKQHNHKEFNGLITAALWQHLYDYCKKGDLCSRTDEVANIIALVIENEVYTEV